MVSHLQIGSVSCYFCGYSYLFQEKKIAQIHSLEGLKKHISYWNMPFAPINKAKHFLEEVKADLSKVECPVLLQQSQNDKQAM
jgi:esterase/lipase